jgi:hypothetical protein
VADSQERKFSPCRLIGLGGVLIVIVGVILIGGGALMFIHIPSMAITFGITFFVLLATFGTDFLKFIPIRNRLSEVHPAVYSYFRFPELQTQPEVCGNCTIRRPVYHRCRPDWYGNRPYSNAQKSE